MHKLLLGIEHLMTDIQFGRALPGHMEGAIEGGKAK